MFPTATESPAGCEECCQGDGEQSGFMGWARLDMGKGAQNMAVIGYI